MLFDEVWLLQFVLGQAFNPEDTQIKDRWACKFKRHDPNQGHTDYLCRDVSSSTSLGGYAAMGCYACFQARYTDFNGLLWICFCSALVYKMCLIRFMCLYPMDLMLCWILQSLPLKIMCFLTREAKLSRPTVVKNLQKTENCNAFGLILWGAPGCCSFTSWFMISFVIWEQVMVVGSHQGLA